MADEILNCGSDEPIHIPDWENVIGDKTLSNGGYFGDLLEVTRVHLEDAKNKGELREQDAGVAYGTAIMESMKEAIKFELQEGQSKLEMCLLRAQIDKIESDIINDTCMATAECALKGAQQAEIELRTSDILPLQAEELVEQIDLLQSKDVEQIAQTVREDCKATSQCALNDQQIEKLICDCTNDTKETDSRVELNDQQIEKLICDCTNNTKETDSKVSLNAQQIEKLICDCKNDTNSTDSKISLNAAQENKLACDCCNDSKRTEGQLELQDSQAKLYERQIEGFNDNANQKIYDTQMQAWAMVFQDTNLEVVEPSIVEENIKTSFDRIQSRLSTAAGDTYNPLPLPVATEEL